MSRDWQMENLKYSFSGLFKPNRRPHFPLKESVAEWFEDLMGIEVGRHSAKMYKNEILTESLSRPPARLTNCMIPHHEVLRLQQPYGCISGAVPMYYRKRMYSVTCPSTSIVPAQTTCCSESITVTLCE